MMRICFWTVLVLFTFVTTKIIHYSSMAYVPLSFLGSIEIYKIINGKSLVKDKTIPIPFKYNYNTIIIFYLFINLSKGDYYEF